MSTATGLAAQTAELCRLAATLSLRPLPFVDLQYTARFGWQARVEVRPPRRRDRWAESRWYREPLDAVADLRAQVDQLIIDKRAERERLAEQNPPG